MGTMQKRHRRLREEMAKERIPSLEVAKQMASAERSRAFVAGIKAMVDIARIAAEISRAKAAANQATDEPMSVQVFSTTPIDDDRCGRLVRDINAGKKGRETLRPVE